MIRRRSISRTDAAVWCPGGRWGPRRVRTAECQSIVRAENLYTQLIRQSAKSGIVLRPGDFGTATYRFGGRSLTASWEAQSNSIWRFGRIFFKCPLCMRRCTRMYLPLPESTFGCRSCWGLSYVARALQNYKDSLWGRGPLAGLFGTTQRDWACMHSEERRKERKAAQSERQRLRRRHVRKVLALSTRRTE